MKTLDIVKLFSRYYIAVFIDGVMQYTVYGGYKTLSSAKSAANKRGLAIYNYRV